MSRIGRMPVALPAKVEIKVEGEQVTVKGPKGTLTRTFSPEVEFQTENGTINVVRKGEERHQRELHGLSRSLLNNMVTGVSTGFRRTLVIEGVGYRAEMQGKNIVFLLGYSHTIPLEPPKDVTFSIGDPKGTTVHIDGIDKEVVGQLAANIRSLRPPEPYLGKGVRYEGEKIRRKAGKAGKGK